MSFDDDLIEYGITDANDYIDYLSNEADRMYDRMIEREENYLSEEELADIEEERAVKRRKAEERRIKWDTERLTKELVLKQWIVKNPEKAKIWYAYFSKSTVINSKQLELFTKVLGAENNYILDDLDNSEIYISKSTEKYSAYNQRNDPYYKYLNSAYFSWKEWIEEYEEYQEFKIKDYKNWRSIVSEIKALYIRNAVIWLFTDKESGLYDTDMCKLSEFLDVFIKDNTTIKDLYLIDTEDCDENKIELWYAWLKTDNNTEIFNQWAMTRYQGWEKDILFEKNIKLEYAYKEFFNKLFLYEYDEFQQWIDNAPEEWNYWKDYIEERIYIKEFKDRKFAKSYCPEYKLNLHIEELRFMSNCGRQVFHNNLAMVYDGKKYGYINTEWDIVIQPQYNYAEEFVFDMACVGKEGKYGVINKVGEYIIMPNYSGLILASEDLVFFCVKETIVNKQSQMFNTTKWGIMDIECNIISSPKYSQIKLLQNGLIAASIIDKYSNEIWGLLVKDGREISPFKYSYIYDSPGIYMLANICAEFNEHLKVFNDGEWGYLDINGSEVKPFIFAEDLDSFMRLKDYEIEE